jgi:hypothetical protein
VIYFVVLALVLVLAGVLDLCVLGVLLRLLLLVGLLLSYTLFSCFLFLGYTIARRHACKQGNETILSKKNYECGSGTES